MAEWARAASRVVARACVIPISATKAAHASSEGANTVRPAMSRREGPTAATACAGGAEEDGEDAPKGGEGKRGGGQQMVWSGGETTEQTLGEGRAAGRPKRGGYIIQIAGGADWGS